MDFGPQNLKSDSGFDPHDNTPKDELVPEVSEIGNLIVLVALMTVFVLLETGMEHHHVKFGHAAGVVFLLGIITSIIVFNVGYMLKSFGYIALFDYALPFILYNDGYNMRKQRFYKEMSNIHIQGVLTTFLGLGIMITLIVYALKLDFVRESYHYDNGVW